MSDLPSPSGAPLPTEPTAAGAVPAATAEAAAPGAWKVRLLVAAVLGCLLVLFLLPGYLLTWWRCGCPLEALGGCLGSRSCWLMDAALWVAWCAGFWLLVMRKLPSGKSGTTRQQRRAQEEDLPAE